MISRAQCFGRERELVRFGGEIDGRGHLMGPLRGPLVGEPLLAHARTVPTVVMDAGAQ